MERLKDPKLLKIILDKMLYNNKFNLYSTFAIYNQNPNTDVCYSEYDLVDNGITVNSNAQSIIVPMPCLKKYIDRNGELISIELTTDAEVELILDDKIKVIEELFYQDYVFIDIRDTFSTFEEPIKQTTRSDLLPYKSILFQTISLFINKSDLTIIEQNLKSLARKSYLSEKYIYIEMSLSENEKIIEIFSLFLTFLIEQTSTASSESKKFEYEICKYIVLKTFIKVDLFNIPIVSDSIDINISIERCFKILDFICDNISELQVEVIETINNQHLPDTHFKDKKQSYEN